MKIDQHEIGLQKKTFVIAEIGLAHDGSLGAAHAYIDAVAATGAQAVKFQTHIAEAEGTERENFRVRVFPQDANRQDYWRRTAFTPSEWKELSAHARASDLVFLSSPFSDEAVDLLLDLDVPAWKIASGEIGNLPLIERCAATGRAVLLSSGMSSWEELDAAIRCVQERDCPVAVLQCRTQYPTPPEAVGLDMIQQLAERYDIPIGMSDHSGRTCSALAARTLGACILEVHVTFHRASFGPDVPASLTLEDLSSLMSDLQFLDSALSTITDKNQIAQESNDLRKLFTKSVVLAQDFAANTRLRAQDLVCRKPGDGIPAAEFKKVVGRSLRVAGVRNQALQWDDLK